MWISTRTRGAALLALLALAGCDDARADASGGLRDGAPPASAGDAAGTRPGDDLRGDDRRATADAGAAADGRSSVDDQDAAARTGVARAPAEPEIDDRAAAPPTASMPRTTALMLDPRARVGVTLGHPPGFLLDNPSMILMWERGDGPRAKIVVKRLGGPGLESSREDALLAASEAVGLRDARFGAFADAVAGPERWPARIAAAEGRGLGDGAPREALAVVVDVPELEAIGVIGAWPEGEPGAERLLDVVRHLARCKVVVGSGCVPDP